MANLSFVAKGHLNIFLQILLTLRVVRFRILGLCLIIVELKIAESFRASEKSVDEIISNERYAKSLWRSYRSAGQDLMEEEVTFASLVATERRYSPPKFQI
jgi:hypothetical protein